MCGVLKGPGVWNIAIACVTLLVAENERNLCLRLTLAEGD